MNGIDIREETDGRTVLSAPRLAALVILVLAEVCSAAADAEKPSAQTQPGEKQLADARAVLQQRLDPLTPKEKQRVEGLIRNLGDRKWKVRKQATEELLRLRPEAVSLVQQAAESNDPEVATRARLVLERLRGKADNIGYELNPAVNTLSAARDKKVVSMLIGLLNHTNPCVRYTAEYGLRRITDKNFGYNSHDEPEKRAEAVEKWRQWWEKNQAGFTFPKVDRKSSGLLICDDQGAKLSAVTPDGKVAWSRKLPHRATCAAGLPNGNVLVGYQNGQVVEYDANFKEVWKFTKITGYIVDISRLAGGNILITVYPQKRILEVNRAGKVVWEKQGFARPYSARRLGNGNILVTELNGGMVSEYSRVGKIVWQKTGLGSPYDAVKLPSGNILIAEHGRRRVIKVNIVGEVIWQQGCPASPSSLCPLPDGTIAVRLWGRGVILMDRNGKTIRQLVKDRGWLGRVRLAPAAVMKPKQSATGNQPSAKTKK